MKAIIETPKGKIVLMGTSKVQRQMIIAQLELNGIVVTDIKITEDSDMVTPEGNLIGLEMPEEYVLETRDTDHMKVLEEEILTKDKKEIKLLNRIAKREKRKERKKKFTVNDNRNMNFGRSRGNR